MIKAQQRTQEAAEHEVSSRWSTAPDAKYELLGEIASSDTVTVYEAFDRSTQRRVAIRELNPRHHSNDSLRALFRQEAIYQSHVEHAHLLAVHTTVEKKHWIVTELWTHSLAIEAANRSFDVAEVERILVDILGALAACHANGVMHAHIGPAALLRDAAGKVKLSRSAGPDFAGSSMNGERASKYFAPELILPDEFGPIGFASDLYCLAFTIVELLAGPKRFCTLFRGIDESGASPDEAWGRWHTAPAERLPDVEILFPSLSKGIGQTLNIMLSKQVAERCLNAGEALSLIEGKGTAASAPVVRSPSMLDRISQVAEGAMQQARVSSKQSESSRDTLTVSQPVKSRSSQRSSASMFWTVGLNSLVTILIVAVMMASYAAQVKRFLDDRVPEPIVPVDGAAEDIDNDALQDPGATVPRWEPGKPVDQPLADQPQETTIPSPPAPEQVETGLSVPVSQTARLVIRSKQRGLFVLVDGEVKGTANGSFEVDPGRHSVEFFLPGHISSMVTIDADPGAKIEFAPELDVLAVNPCYNSSFRSNKDLEILAAIIAMRVDKLVKTNGGWKRAEAFVDQAWSNPSTRDPRLSHALAIAKLQHTMPEEAIDLLELAKSESPADYILPRKRLAWAYWLVGDSLAARCECRELLSLTRATWESHPASNSAKCIHREAIEFAGELLAMMYVPVDGTIAVDSPSCALRSEIRPQEVDWFRSAFALQQMRLRPRSLNSSQGNSLAIDRERRLRIDELMSESLADEYERILKTLPNKSRLPATMLGRDQRIDSQHGNPTFSTAR